MSKKFLFLAILLGAIYSNASEIFSGTWKGTGVYRLNGDHTYCKNFEMTFKGAGDYFEFTSGKRDCEKHNEVFYKVPLEFKDNGYYFNKQKVGELNGNVMTLAFSQPEGDGRTRHWRMYMKKQGDTLVYEESRVMDQEVTPMISFAGILGLVK